jgi:hypothetical protein
MQFTGAFGLFEIATAVAFLFCPNIWRLPVIEAETSDRTKIRLAASVAFIPHWAGAAKALAGVIMVSAAARTEGLSWASLNLVLLAAATGVLVVCLSALVARWGVARPDLDVVQFTLHRPKRKHFEFPGISISASLVQIVIGAITLPVVEVLPPSVLYQPELAPSATFTAWTLAAAAAAAIAMLFAWRGRLARIAPREQQRKAEEPA